MNLMRTYKLRFTLTLLSILAVMTACNTTTTNEYGDTRDLERFPRITFSTKTLKPSGPKKVLLISGSVHKGGSTDTLIDEFMRGAKEAGNEVEKIFLHDYKINFYSDEQLLADMDSASTPADDAQFIIEKMRKADVIVMASPVYFWTIDGMMKTLIDRTFYCFRKFDEGKEYFFITVCGNSDIHVTDGAINAFRGFISCTPNPVERGVIRVPGIHRVAELKQTDWPQKAYEMGKTVGK